MPNFTTVTGGTPSGGGSPAGGAPTGGGGNPFGGGRRAADYFVQAFQHPFEQKLAAISQLAKTDPAAAQQQLVQAVTEFQSQSDAFLQTIPNPIRGQYQQVVDQAMSTPALMQTVNALWTETGGEDFYSKSSGTSGSGGGIINNLGTWLRLGLSLGKIKMPSGTTPTVPPPTTAGSGPETQPTNTSKVPGMGGPTVPSIPDPNVNGFLESLRKYAPELLTAGSIFANLFGASQASNSAKEAAAIQAESANRATELQRNIYNRNRSDQLPWLNTGTRAEYRLSDLMGLTPTPQVMPDPNGIPPINVSGQTPGSPAGPPGPTLSTVARGQPQQFNINQMAAKYQRPVTP